MDYDIGRFNGGVATQSAHCDSRMAEGEDGSVIDAVAYKSYPITGILPKFLYVLHFAVGSKSP